MNYTIPGSCNAVPGGRSPVAAATSMTAELQRRVVRELMVFTIHFPLLASAQSLPLVVGRSAANLARIHGPPVDRCARARSSSSKLRRICNQRFPRRVRAELKLLQMATHASCGLFRIKRDLVVRFRLTQNAGRRFRIGVADKKSNAADSRCHLSRENIRERFRRHHSTLESVNAPGTRRCVADGFSIQNEWIDISHQLQSQQIAAGSCARRS